MCVSDSSSIPSPQPHTFQINFNSLYTALCEQQKSDQVTLLLYTLLHQNSNMRTYILSRTDMENLVRSRAFHSAYRTHAFQGRRQGGAFVGRAAPNELLCPPTFHPLPSLLNMIDFKSESETDKTAHIRKRLHALASVRNCTQSQM